MGVKSTALTRKTTALKQYTFPYPRQVTFDGHANNDCSFSEAMVEVTHHYNAAKAMDQKSSFVITILYPKQI